VSVPTNKLWRQVDDPVTKRSFFFNDATGETRWALDEAQLQAQAEALSASASVASLSPTARSNAPGVEAQTQTAPSKPAAGHRVGVRQSVKRSVSHIARHMSHATVVTRCRRFVFCGTRYITCLLVSLTQLSLAIKHPNS
jgi:hypothetical protein